MVRIGTSILILAALSFMPFEYAKAEEPAVQTVKATESAIEAQMLRFGVYVAASHGEYVTHVRDLTEPGSVGANDVASLYPKIISVGEYLFSTVKTGDMHMLWYHFKDGRYVAVSAARCHYLYGYISKMGYDNFILQEIDKDFFKGLHREEPTN